MNEKTDGNANVGAFGCFCQLLVFCWYEKDIDLLVFGSFNVDFEFEFDIDIDFEWCWCDVMWCGVDEDKKCHWECMTS